MVRHALDRNYDVVAVCRAQSVDKLGAFAGRISVVPGPTDDPAVIAQAVEGCDGALVVLVPFGVDGYATGTAQAVLDHAPPGARLVFSCGWHITRDGRDVYPWKLPARPLSPRVWPATLRDHPRWCASLIASLRFRMALRTD
jgi:hypothetical protein